MCVYTFEHLSKGGSEIRLGPQPVLRDLQDNRGCQGQVPAFHWWANWWWGESEDWGTPTEETRDCLTILGGASYCFRSSGQVCVCVTCVGSWALISLPLGLSALPYLMEARCGGWTSSAFPVTRSGSKVASCGRGTAQHTGHPTGEHSSFLFSFIQLSDPIREKGSDWCACGFHASPELTNCPLLQRGTEPWKATWA